MLLDKHGQVGKQILGNKYSELSNVKMADFDFSDIIDSEQLFELIKKVALPIEKEEAKISRLINKSKFLQKQSNDLYDTLLKGSQMKLQQKREALEQPEEFMHRGGPTPPSMDKDRAPCLGNFLEKKIEGKGILDSYLSEKSGYFPALISNKGKKVPERGDSDGSILTRKGYRNIDTTKSMILKDLNQFNTHLDKFQWGANGSEHDVVSKVVDKGKTVLKSVFSRQPTITLTYPDRKKDNSTEKPVENIFSPRSPAKMRHSVPVGGSPVFGDKNR